MAARSTYGLKTIGSERVILSCTFLPAGTGAPTGLVGKGFASVARTGVGLFTLTLQDKWPALEGFTATLMQAAAGSLVAELDDETVASTKTILIRTINKATGAAADIAADADNRVSITLFLRNTSVT